MDACMFFVTQFGGALFFVLMAGGVLYTVGKKQAYLFCLSYLLGLACIGGLKAGIHRQRPFEVGALSIGDKTTGYSMPSGHAYSSAMVFVSSCKLQGDALVGGSVLWKKRAVVQKTSVVLGGVVCLLVALSRMYLGQHYLTDVLAGLVLGALLAVALPKLLALLGDKEENLAYVLVPLAVLVSMVVGVLCLQPVTSAVYKQYLQIVKICGACAGFFVGYLFEKKWIGHPAPGTARKALARLVLGGGVALVLFVVLGFLPNQPLFGFVRYFCVVFWGMCGAFWVFAKCKL